MLFFSLFFTAATVMCFSVLPVSASQPKSSMEAERPSNISQSSFAGLGSRMSPNVEMLANVDQQSAVLTGPAPPAKKEHTFKVATTNLFRYPSYELIAPTLSRN
uniref:Secreted protein n=1 Tax=Moniliophthora roreri TaxID=221103 RepID=A0A0W0FQL8_MONRR